MRILLVTSDHPFAGQSGVATYCRDLESELATRGHEVYHLFSSDRTWSMRPHLRWSMQAGMTFASLVNSPLPPLVSPEHPLADCSHVQVERLFAACLDRIAPDLVHFHALQGFSGSVLPLARTRRIPVVLTLHDYWALCTRIVLSRTNGEPCSGPDGGANCARFCSDHGPLRRRLYRRLMAVVPEGPALRLLRRAGSLYTHAAPGPHDPWMSPGIVHPDGKGRPADILAHGTRAALLLRMLLEAETLLAVSEFVKETFVRHGVPAHRIQVLRLGLSLPQQVTWRIRRAQSPLRVGFLGRVVPIKGAHILARAVRGIPPTRARVTFYGPASRDGIADLQRMAGDMPLEFRGPYRREALPGILDELDVVVVPTLMPEPLGLAPLEAQAAGLPVVASRIGAVPEHIEDGQNGFLFEPGNADDLRAKLTALIEAPQRVAEMSARTAPPMSIDRHVDALSEIYQGCLQGRSRAHASQRA